ncbi:rod shape-determining protein MreD [Algirhabdus cladophorae]|uniref:rod shape-determining protein MreD n=1 Tax=Algirhabdus cladophorae TaxID=3377108 RepID=UPI003B84946A
MAETVAERRLVYWTLYVMIAFVLFFIHFLPQQTMPAQWAAPDILLVLTYAWTVRRPEFIPLALIAGMFLLADFLFHRPPGLMAACVVIGAEFLRSRAMDIGRSSFSLEWLLVSCAIAGGFVVARIITGLALIPQAPLNLGLIQTALSIACYPIVAALSHYVLGVRPTVRGSAEDVGARI